MEYDGPTIGFGVPPMPDFWLGPGMTGDGFRESHIAFGAPDRDAVDRRSSRRSRTLRSTRPSLRRLRSRRTTAAEHWRPTARICVGSSSGPPTTTSPCSPRLGRTSSCGEGPWRNGGLRHRRSTGGFRPCVASTGSLTSTAASARTRPSTYAAHRSTLPMLKGSIGRSSACSSPPPTTTTAPTRPWPCCSA